MLHLLGMAPDKPVALPTWGLAAPGLVGNVGIMSCRQHPPNDMSSRHMSSCRQNVGNVGPTLGKKMSSQPAKQHVDKTSSKILPTCRLNLLDIKKKSKTSQKIALLWYDLVRKSHEYGNVYIISCIRTIFILKNNHYVRWSNGYISRGYGWAVVRRHVSRHMTQP